MTAPPATDDLWRLWAPPLSPPEDVGLPADIAEELASGRECCPHCVAADLWRAYAGMLPAGQPVLSVTTGAQNVTYAQPGGCGDAAAAMARANWHQSLCECGSMHSVLTRAKHPPPRWIIFDPLFWDDYSPWWRVKEDP